MIKKEIYGDNYSGSYNRIRAACRALIIENGMILLSYEKAGDLWMIPGGGLENGETYEECCIREAAEETGRVIEISECVLEIDEYYEKCKYETRYYFGTVTGKTNTKLTEEEIKAELIPQRLPLRDAFDDFSKHALYADTDETKRGLYLREYTALTEIVK